MSRIATPPFYAVEVRPAVIAWTGAGLRIDAEARVIGGDERPIPGLFAAASDANRRAVMSGLGRLYPFMLSGSKSIEAAATEHQYKGLNVFLFGSQIQEFPYEF